MAEDFRTTLARQRKANAAVFAGDAEPYIAMWARRGPVSLFGGWGPCRTDRGEMRRVFGWVGSRFGAGTEMTTDFEVEHVGTDVAYTVGYEHGHASIDGGPARPMRIRVTHIYRLEDGEWRLVHRHGDFAPVDESPGVSATAGN